MQLLQRLLLAGTDVGDARQLLLRDAARVERPHRELRPRLADGLRGDDAHGHARLDQFGVRQIQPVAPRADAHSKLTGERAADTNALQAAGLDDPGQVLGDQVALGDD